MCWCMHRQHQAQNNDLYPLEKGGVLDLALDGHLLPPMFLSLSAPELIYLVVCKFKKFMHIHSVEKLNCCLEPYRMLEGGQNLK